MRTKDERGSSVSRPILNIMHNITKHFGGDYLDCCAVFWIPRLLVSSNTCNPSLWRRDARHPQSRRVKTQCSSMNQIRRIARLLGGGLSAGPPLHFRGPTRHQQAPCCVSGKPWPGSQDSSLVGRPGSPHVVQDIPGHYSDGCPL